MPTLRANPHRAPLCFLLLCTPLIIESCLTAATPPSHWLNPGIAFILIFAYGPPILWLRELWVRRQLPLPALFVMGLVYGLFNEGILAHTITQIGGDPLTHFIGYDEFASIHWAWASLLLPWHGFNSVCFMILFAHLLFPQSSRQSWVGARTFKYLGILKMLSLGLYFIIYTPSRLAPPHAFFIFVPLMLLLLLAALKWKGHWIEPDWPSRAQIWRSGLFGLFPHMLIVMCGFGFAENKVPLPLYFLMTGGATMLLLWAMSRVRWPRILAFMLGGSLPLVLFSAYIAQDYISVITLPGYLLLAGFGFRKLLAAAPGTNLPIKS